jgi:hypothetical protein
MQLDATLNNFRLASRELFNHHFRASDAGSNDAWSLVERFREVEELLFQKLVSEPFDLGKVRYGEPQLGITVALRNGLETAPIMVNREVDTGYWDHPLVTVPRAAEMIFVSFFDWDQLSYRDNQYVRVRLNSWPAHPEIGGKHALIESHNVLFSQAAGGGH